jgi:hypothetical protein
MTMRTRHSIALGTAALSAATATGCTVALLSGANPRSHVLIAAEAVATIGVVSLLVGMLVAYLLTRRQSRLKPALQGAHDRLPADDCAACLHKRREVLDERLNIDEPRLCSQYMIRCTCWSFCAGSEGQSSIAEAERCVAESASPAAQELIRMRNRLVQAKVLPLLHRNGMDNCPFRFTSPYARSAPADDLAPDSPESGTAAR